MEIPKEFVEIGNFEKVGINDKLDTSNENVQNSWNIPNGMGKYLIGLCTREPINFTRNDVDHVQIIQSYFPQSIKNEPYKLFIYDNGIFCVYTKVLLQNDIEYELSHNTFEIKIIVFLNNGEKLLSKVKISEEKLFLFVNQKRYDPSIDYENITPVI